MAKLNPPKRIAKLLIATAVLTLSAGPAMALDSFFSGPRAMGMAGANIASVNDTNAQYYNPAAFGFMGCKADDGSRIACDNNNLGKKKMGLDLNVSAGIRMHEDFGSYVDTLASIDYTALSNNGIQTQSDLQDLINLLNGLKALEDPGNAISADINAHLGLRAGHFAIGSHAFLQAAGNVLDIDSANLGITSSATSTTNIDRQNELNAEITGAFSTPAGYQRVLIDSTLYNNLIAAGLTDAAINSVDAMAVLQGVTPVQIVGLSETMVDVTTQTINGSTTTLDDNHTTISLNGFAVGEIPLSYGYAFNDHWSVGGNLKIMKGRIYGTEILVFNQDSGDTLSEVTDNYQDSTNFGLDLAVMGRYNKVNFGLVGRNLNSPKFDGFSQQVNIKDSTGNIINTKTIIVDDVEIEPQFAMGIAYIPFETLTLELDYDLTKNKVVLEGKETQNLSVGLEWDAFKVLALRCGIYKNMAQNDIGVVYTAGLGLNMWLARLDIGGAYAAETAQYDGDDYPKEARIAAQLSIVF